MGQPKGAPVLIAYTNPFRLVLKDNTDQWSPSLDDINKSEYDYVKLHRLSTSIDIGLPYPLCLHIGFDGSLLLPAIKEYDPLEKAIDIYNQVLGEILLGGIYCEAVEPSDIDRGILYITGYFRSSGMAKSLTGQLQNMLKTKVASPLHQIQLLDPDKITAREIHDAIQKGKGICESISNLSVMLVLQGVSSFIAHNWSESLSNFWIGIEQTISFLWNQEVISGGRTPTFNVKGRKDFLTDTRTWTTSTRIEMLFQKAFLDDESYNLLHIARKSRNDLVHSGKTPSAIEAEAAFDALFRLISLVHFGVPDTLVDMIKRYKAIDPFTKRSLPTEPIPLDELDGIWFGPLPPIPGEKEWEDKDYPKVYPSDS